MRAHAAAVILFSLAGVLASPEVHSGRIESIEITLQATVTRVVGGGSFTTPTPDGATVVRQYRVTEIPNFYWQAGHGFDLRWTLTPAELAFQYGGGVPPCSAYPHFQFAGVNQPHGDVLGACDGKLTDNQPFHDVYEFQGAATGPSLDLQTGVVTPFYAPRTLWTADYCCAYLYDYLTDSFVAGDSANLPQSDNTPFYSLGEIGAHRGVFSYTYAVDPVGSPVRDYNRPPFETGTAQILFDAVWRVDGRRIPEPGSLPLASLTVALVLILLCRAGASRHRGARAVN
jgi:hypothetical protein